MSSNIHSLSTLQGMSLAELESLYEHAATREWAPGLYRGHYLVDIGAPKSRPLAKHLITEIGFRYTPFWIDHHQQKWAFFHPRLAAGHYRVSLGASRWRDTECCRMDYASSRLPQAVKTHLYDEVKPLSDELCLGIGGFNAGEGVGDYFFFALQRE